MKYWVLLALAAVLLFSGCIQQPPTTQTCPAHYMKIGSDCCLDDNGDGICDRDEPNTQVCPPQTKTIEDRVKECGRDSSCITNLAIETNNPNMCTGIIDNDRCLEQLSARYNNPAYCNLLNYDFQKKDCLSKFDGNNATCPPTSCPTVSYPICPSANTTAPTINLTCPKAPDCPHCNLTLADKIDQCKQKSIPYGESDCLIALALETNTPSICSSSYQFDVCYTQMAVKYKNKGYCDLIGRSDLADTCKSKVE